MDLAFRDAYVVEILRRIGERTPERSVAGFVIPSPYFDVELHPDGLLRVNNPGRHRIEVYTVGRRLRAGMGQAVHGPSMVSAGAAIRSTSPCCPMGGM
jgi:hypothetical protein